MIHEWRAVLLEDRTESFSKAAATDAKSASPSGQLRRPRRCGRNRPGLPASCAAARAATRAGGWEAWIEFFLEGVIETAEQGDRNANRLVALFGADRQRIEGLGRPSGSALRIHSELQKAPIPSVPLTAKRLALSQPTVQKSFDHLQALGLVTEITGRARWRLQRHDRYLEILAEGTEPLPASCLHGVASLRRPDREDAVPLRARDVGLIGRRATQDFLARRIGQHDRGASIMG
jgi:hypothetical protein